MAIKRTGLLGFILLALVGLLPATAFAETGLDVVDTYFFDHDPPNGALIFQQRDGLEGSALTNATGSPYTHVGIIRNTGGGPYVMQSSAATGGVEELPLDAFIELGIGLKFAIYVTRKDIRPKGQLNSPASVTAYDYYHRPYDPLYAQGADALYSAELVYDVFKKIGHPIGRMQKIGDLNFDTSAGRDFLLGDWQQRKACRSEKLSRQACWTRIQQDRIVTPASLAQDGFLKLYLTTF